MLLVQQRLCMQCPQQAPRCSQNNMEELCVSTGAPTASLRNSAFTCQASLIWDGTEARHSLKQ